MSARTLRRAHDVTRHHVAFIPHMHAYFLLVSNLHLTKLMCRGLVFADLVLVNFSGPNLPFLLDMFF